MIPRQLADNAGFDSTDILNLLRVKHNNHNGNGQGEAGKWVGVDVDVGMAGPPGDGRCALRRQRNGTRAEARQAIHRRGGGNSTAPSGLRRQPVRLRPSAPISSGTA